MATRNLVPRNSGEGGVGKLGKSWATGFFDNLYINDSLVSDISSNKSDGYLVNQSLQSGDNVTFASGNFTEGLTLNGVDVSELGASFELARSGDANYVFFSDAYDNQGHTEKTYYNTVNPSTVLSGISVEDASDLRVSVVWDGPHDSYMGTAFINNQEIPLLNIEELGEKTRRFKGYLDNLNLTGNSSIVCTANGRTTSLSLTEVGSGPQPYSISIDHIANAQPASGHQLGTTHLKENDLINIFVDFDQSGVDKIKVYDFGLSKGVDFDSYVLNDIGSGISRAVIPTLVSNRTGEQSVVVQIVNTFGSTGDISQSTDFSNPHTTRLLDQNYPQITANDPTNFNGRSDGLREGESTILSSSISNWSSSTDTVLYSATTNDILISNSGIFETQKTISYVQGVFENQDNLNITAVRTNNGAIDSEGVTVKIANSPEILSINIITPAISSVAPNIIGTSKIKGGDVVNVEVNVDTKGIPDSDISLSILNSGFSNGTQTSYSSYSKVTNPNQTITYTVPITVTNSVAKNGNQGIIARARGRINSNNFIYSDTHDSTNDSNSFAVLENSFPVISFGAVSYPNNQQALKGQELATVSNTITNFDTVQYTTTNNELNIINPNLYQTQKQIQLNSGTYNISNNNFNIKATKTSNGAVINSSTVVNIANTPIQLSVLNLAAKLKSSNSGEIYNFELLGSQRFLSAPSLSIPTTQTNPSVLTIRNAGTQTNDNEYSITVSDSDTKGEFYWTVSAENLAGIITTSIISNPSYILEGFESRTINASPNSLAAGLADIGTEVSNPSGISFENLSEGGTAANGGTIYDYKFYQNGTQLDNTFDENNKFTICDSSGLVDSQGAYVFNLDKLNRSANTSTSNPASFIIEE
jgi:hypothetical protein